MHRILDSLYILQFLKCMESGQIQWSGLTIEEWEPC